MDEPLLTEVENAPRQGVGPIVGIIIVVMLIVLGGLYFLITQEAKLHATPTGQGPAHS